MKIANFLLLFNLLGLIYSCTATREEEEPFKSSASLTVFNDFIPSNFSEVPNIEIKSGKYFNRVIGKYRVDALVDSLKTNLGYLRIKDSIENTIYKGYTLNGKKNGWWEVYTNNTLVCCGNYVSNKKSGFWRYYNLKDESRKVVYFKNDELDGLAQKYSADSILLSEGHYVKGLKSDYWKYFYTNGKIKEQGYFYEGYKSGWWQSFESNGNFLEEASYSRNEISGFVKKYLNGVLFEEGKFNGRRRGTWKFYDEVGKLKSIHEYGK